MKMNLWFNALIFPGVLFFLLLSIIIEHVNGRVYKRFSFRAEEATSGSAAMFIPIVYNFKILTQKRTQKSLTTKGVIQNILLAPLIVIPLIGALFLPINLLGKFPAKSGGYGRYIALSRGRVGVFSFEGDTLFLFGLVVLFGIFVLAIQLFSAQKPRKEAFKSYLRFAVWDIPFFLALTGFIITRGSLSLSLLAHDIRLIVDTNRVFGFLFLLPIGTLLALFSLAFKFDQPFFDTLPWQQLHKGINSPPLERSWQLLVWNVAMRLMEALLLGIITTICLGGPHLPIPEPTNELLASLATSLNFSVKCIFGGIIINLIRAMQPRMRFNQVMNYSLKILTPISLFSLVLISIYITLGQIYQIK